MRVKFYIFFLVMISMATMPVYSFANTSKTETTTMSCCSVKGGKTTKKMSCCNTKKQKTNDDGCGGNCKHKSCECPTSCFTVIFNKELSQITKSFSTVKNTKSIVTQTIHLSKGYYSIWTPPDIA